jgi:hypothetical protein
VKDECGFNHLEGFSGLSATSESHQGQRDGSSASWSKKVEKVTKYYIQSIMVLFSE